MNAREGAAEEAGMFGIDFSVLKEHEDTVRLVLYGIGSLFTLGIVGYLVSWRNYRRKVFMDRIHFSANIVDRSEGGPYLRLRCWKEDNLRDTLDNPVLRRLVLKAARRCTGDVPFVIIPNAMDQWVLNTTILNYMSSMTPESNVARLAGRPVQLNRFVFAVTCEPYGSVKIRKLRVMIIREEDLKRFLDPAFRDSLKYEVDHHRDRTRTLHTMARAMCDPELATLKEQVIGVVEIPSVKVEVGSRAPVLVEV